MIERAIILIVLAGLAMLAYRLMRAWQVRRAVRAAADDPLLANLRPGVPAILYFTTPTCAPCNTQQRPALAALAADMGDRVQIIEVNALVQPDAADRWGVLSVPTTFILDGFGRPQQVNHGATNVDTLKRQVASASRTGM